MAFFAVLDEQGLLRLDAPELADAAVVLAKPAVDCRCFHYHNVCLLIRYLGAC